MCHAAGEAPHRFHLLRLAELLLQTMALGAEPRLAKLPLDRRSQTIEVALHHVVVRARPHGRNRGLFPDRSGNEDERQLAVRVANQGQGFRAFEPGHVVIRDDNVPGTRIQRRAEGRLRIHTKVRDLVARALQLADCEMAVALVVLDDEYLKLLIVHSRSSAPAAAGSGPASKDLDVGPPP